MFQIPGCSSQTAGMIEEQEQGDGEQGPGGGEDSISTDQRSQTQISPSRAQISTRRRRGRPLEARGVRKIYAKARIALPPQREMMDGRRVVGAGRRVTRVGCDEGWTRHVHCPWKMDGR